MRTLMTRKLCAVGMRNAILRNYLKLSENVYFTVVCVKSLTINLKQGQRMMVILGILIP